ncbi:hypothetical protein ACIRG8_29400 [Streptomyces sp. NPDC102359]|uniref:hypothetical protein n=1 Tax=Streptomyces sp. NPDC102359 TaxID=3366159 RepID=UPI003827D189
MSHKSLPLLPPELIPLYEKLWAGPMFSRWHWLQYNFAAPRHGQPETYFAAVTMDALLACDAVMPGFADEMLQRLSEIGGREKDPNDYEQILQWLGELLVLAHFATWKWPTTAVFAHEPTAGIGKANPEVVIDVGHLRLGVEVKTPNLRLLTAGREGRGRAPWQLNARIPKEFHPRGPSTKPRDNPVKDFLVSANRKFEGFRSDPNFYSVLVIVWDDYINEPLTALLSQQSGLLTPNSFHRDNSDQPHTYPNVDAVVVLRQQHQFKNGMANRPALDDRDHFLDYGSLDRFPFNSIVMNPHGRALPQDLCSALQAHEPATWMGAEYVPGELVMWASSNKQQGKPPTGGDADDDAGHHDG